VARAGRVHLAAEALAAGPYDLGVFALKSFDTAAALASFKGSSGAAHVCFQNGVDNESAMTRALGTERVIAGTVTSAGGQAGVGQVVLERRRGVGIAAGHALSQPLREALRQAGLNAGCTRLPCP